MRIKSIIAGCLALFIGGAAAVADDATTNTIDGIATFTTGDVNLRMDPSSTSPYLCYLQGEELYFDPENITWSHQLGRTRVGNEIIFVDHEKIQGQEGLTLPVIGREGDWVKLSYCGHDVWTMKKFLDIKPIVTPTTATTAGESYNQFCLSNDADGSPAIFYQEPGMDEDGGLYIGTKQGNTVVFDHFLPAGMSYDEKTKDLEVSKDPVSGFLVFKFGPNQRLKSFTDWEVIDIKGFSADNIKALLPLAQETAPMIFVTTGRDYVMLPK